LSFFYLLSGKASPGMSLTDTGMTGKPFRTKHTPTDESVTKIRRITMTVDAGRVAPADANVMEHGGFLHKLTV
jgi:hypothetical protein